jgi:hypothetical protein
MRQHTILPEQPTGYALSPCKGMWSIVVPAAATNLITNPSVELVTTGYTASDAAIARATSRQRHGAYSLQVDPSADTGGVYYTIALAPDTTYTWSLDEKTKPGVAYTLSVYDVTNTVYLSSVLEFRGTGEWERRRLSFISGAGTSYRLELRQDGGGSMPRFFTDGWQLAESPYDSTYVDGDQPGCAWVGQRHASISRRDAQSRRGGRIMLLDDFSFTVTGMLGLGMAPAEDITTPTGLLGGALYQRTVARVRTFSLIGMFLASSFAGLQRDQAALHAALSPFTVAEQGPITLRYRAMEGGRPIGDELELLAHYTGGLEGSTDNLYGEQAAISFSMYLPLITSAGESGASLAATETITDADYIVERDSSGAWHALSGGLDDDVHVAIYGPDGNLYVGGRFETAYNAAGTGSPVVVDHIARWDGTSWTVLDSGLNNDVYALAFDAAGNLYAGGLFTDAAYPYLAKWDGSAWGPVDSAGDATGFVYALTIDGSGRLYVGGEFANWAAIADADNIVMWNGSAWEEVNGGVNDAGFALAAVPNTTDTIVVGGDFTQVGATPANRVARYQFVTGGGTWTALSDGFDDTVNTLAFDASGIIYAGGDFTNTTTPYIARRLANWGTSFLWASVGGSSVDAFVWAIARDHATNRMIVGGAFTQAGSIPADRVAQWTGSEWLPLDIDLPGSTNVTAIASHPDGRLAVGSWDAGTATSSTTDATLRNDGNAPAAPIITATGPGRVESIVNWTSRQSIYLDLELQDGETLTIDLTPGAVSVLSSFRGNLGSTVLSGSDLASWRLLPGANTVVAKADVPVVLRWRAAYTSLAGAGY